MMKPLQISNRRICAVALAIAFAVLPAVFGAPTPTLDQVLGHIEKRGAQLKSMSAGITQKKWTDILGEYDAGESGTLLFLKQDGKVYIRKDISSPVANHLVINDGRIVFYQPGIRQAQVHEMGGNKDKAEFLLIGFGTSRRALEEAYEIKLVGAEKVAGKETVAIELTPRSDQVSAYFKKIVLWLDTSTWVPIQQKLVEPTEDHLLVSFDQIKLNPKLSKSDFELKLPKDVHLVGGQ